MWAEVVIMAKRKKTTTRRRSYHPVKRARHVADKAPLSMSVGLAMTGVGMALTPDKHGLSPVGWLTKKGDPIAVKLGNVSGSLYSNATNVSLATPFLVGTAISVIGPKLPVVGRVMQRNVKKITHGHGM
jgi:hypothetical protein